MQALNNLFDAPLVVANAGGKAGGAAVVTPRGLAVIRAFREVEREIGAALIRLESRLEAGLAAPDPEAADEGLGDLFWSLGLRTSARNALRGTVVAIVDDEVTSRIAIDLGDGVEIVSIITRRSREELGLAVGKPVVALIKSSFVVLADGDAPEDGTNRLIGIVADREDGREVSEISLSLSAGKTLVATVRARPRFQASAIAPWRPSPRPTSSSPSNRIAARENPGSRPLFRRPCDRRLRPDPRLEGTFRADGHPHAPPMWRACRASASRSTPMARSTVYEGPLLIDVLAKVGTPTGKAIHGPEMADVVLVKAAGRLCRWRSAWPNWIRAPVPTASSWPTRRTARRWPARTEPSGWWPRAT